MVELIELVLDRGYLRFEFGGECIDSRLLELRDILDFTIGKFRDLAGKLVLQLQCIGDLWFRVNG